MVGRDKKSKSGNQTAKGKVEIKYQRSKIKDQDHKDMQRAIDSQSCLMFLNVFGLPRASETFFLFERVVGKFGERLYNRGRFKRNKTGFVINQLRA
jgi:hypothetical protein